MKITIEGKKLKYDFNLVNASRDEHLFSAYVVAYGAWTRRGLSIPVNYRSWLGSQNGEEVREYVLPITDDEALILDIHDKKKLVSGAQGMLGSLIGV